MFSRVLLYSLAIMFVNCIIVNAACSPNQYQGYYYGTIATSEDVSESHELRIYFIDTNLDNSTEYVYLGSTKDNPGNLEAVFNFSKMGEFEIYACADAADIGRDIGFRYVIDDHEYDVAIVDGDDFFTGQQVSIGTMPDITGNLMELKVVDSGSMNLYELIVHHVLFVGGYIANFDIDENGVVNLDDAKAAKTKGTTVELEVNAQNILHYFLFGGEEQDGFDVNDDGVIDLQDVQALSGSSTSSDSNASLDAADLLQAALFGQTTTNSATIDDVKDFYRGNSSDFEFESEVLEKQSQITEIQVSNPYGEEVTPSSILHALLTGLTDDIYDVDGDGYLTLDDIKAAYSDGNNTSQQDENSTVNSEDILHDILFGENDSDNDLNGDGYIDLNDLKESYEQEKNATAVEEDITSPEYIMHSILFGTTVDEQDLNEDGKVDKVDVKIAYERQENGENATIETPQDSIFSGILFDSSSHTEYDLNQDGQVDTQDYKLIHNDVNKDGVIDSLDAAIILNYILYGQGEEEKDYYDVNEDGEVTEEDVKEVLKSFM